MGDAVSGKRVFRRNEDVLSREVAGEMVLVPIRGSVADMQKLFTLNSVGAFIWAQLDGETTVEQVGMRVQEEFEVTLEEAESDLNQFIYDLLGAGLIEEVK